MIVRRTAIAWLAFAAATAHAQGLREHAGDFWDELKAVVGEGEIKRLRIEYENDIFFSTDRNYTNGVRFTWRAGARQALRFDADDEYPWIPPLRFTAGGDATRRALEDAECRHAAQTDAERDAGRPVCFRTAYNFVFFGHNLYTPTDIRLGPDRISAIERPYAAWAYIGFHRELHASDGRYWRYGIDIGCIGPCAQGQQLQTWVHNRITDSPLPNGWDSQIRNEPGAVARFEYARRLWSAALVPLGEGVFGLPLSADLRPHVNAGLGNIQTYAGAGVTARLGWYRSSYDSMRLDTHALESLAGAPRDRFASAGAGPQADCPAGCGDQPAPAALPPARPPELFAFGRLHGDLVAYNALLQGGMFNRSSPHTAPARPLVFEREFGVAAAFGEFSVSLSAVGRKQWEMDGTRYGQRFGRLAVEFSTRF